MGGGLVMDGLWLHDELAELGLDGPVEDVLRGASERITLPAIEPFRPFVSIPDARRIGGARLLFSKITTGWAGALLSCDVARIRCGEQELAELLRDLILVDRGEADDVRPRRIYDKLDVGRYRMLDGLVRAYSNSGGMMVLYVSPTGRGLHPGFRSDGLRPEVWLGRRLDRMGLMEQVCDVLDGRSPRIDVSDLPQPWAQGEA